MQKRLRLEKNSTYYLKKKRKIMCNAEWNESENEIGKKYTYCTRWISMTLRRFDKLYGKNQESKGFSDQVEKW